MSSVPHILVVGLGNPGDVYQHTRHNIGRIVVTAYAQLLGLTTWRNDQAAHALVATGHDASTTITFLLPETFMNDSGSAVAHYRAACTNLEHLIVVHDDIDLPLGTIRIAFDRGHGGHNGVRSIERALHARAFTRVRVGVVPSSATGTLLKPRGEDAVNAFILKQLRGAAREALLATVPRAVSAVQTIVHSGRDVATCRHNAAPAQPDP